MAQDHTVITSAEMLEIEKQAHILRAQAASHLAKSLGAFLGRVFHIGSSKPKASAV